MQTCERAPELKAPLISCWLRILVCRLHNLALYRPRFVQQAEGIVLATAKENVAIFNPLWQVIVSFFDSTPRLPLLVQSLSHEEPTDRVIEA